MPLLRCKMTIIMMMMMMMMMVLLAVVEVAVGPKYCY